jgi:SH3 domain-containing YSC84-like protein 1
MKDHPHVNFEEGNLDVVNAYECGNEMTTVKETGENVYSKSPLHEHTGIWVSASVPPLTKHDHEEW